MLSPTYNLPLLILSSQFRSAQGPLSTDIIFPQLLESTHRSLPYIIYRRAVEKPFSGGWAEPSGPLHFSVLISETWAPFQLALHLSSCARPVDVRQLALLSGQASRWPGCPNLGVKDPKISTVWSLSISTTLLTSVGHA